MKSIDMDISTIPNAMLVKGFPLTNLPQWSQK
jgi:hypothetical protein